MAKTSQQDFLALIRLKALKRGWITMPPTRKKMIKLNFPNFLCRKCK